MAIATEITGKMSGYNIPTPAGPVAQYGATAARLKEVVTPFQKLLMEGQGMRPVEWYEALNDVYEKLQAADVEYAAEIIKTYQSEKGKR